MIPVPRTNLPTYAIEGHTFDPDDPAIVETFASLEALKAEVKPRRRWEQVNVLGVGKPHVSQSFIATKRPGGLRWSPHTRYSHHPQDFS